MSTFAWLILCAILWVRGSNYRDRARTDRANMVAYRSAYTEIAYKAKTGTLAPAAPRDPEIVTKLRDRAIALEKQLIESQGETKKRDKMIAVLQAQVPKKQRAQ